MWKNTKCVFASPLQKLLRKRATVLRYMYLVCLVFVLLLLCGVLSTMPLPFTIHGIDGWMVCEWCMGKDLGKSDGGLKGGNIPMVA